MDDLRLERQQPPERGDGLRRVGFLEARDEVEAAGGDLEHHGIFAPARIHAPSEARSAGGHVRHVPERHRLRHDRLLEISCACAWISCGVSRTIPFGGAENPGSVGCAEWQAAQRCATIGCAGANGHLRRSAAAGAVAGRIQIASTGDRDRRGRPGSTRASARVAQVEVVADPGADHHQADEDRPASRCPYVNGKWFESIVKSTGSVR